ncbi:YTH domain-containing protein 1-like isoform X4 [Acanthaster planci]|uniref:YTH domain-containing protein 1-like isoform X4 n=1 Tax=Acanthaster planci TaxID=133434 RepID=A0A8B7ZKJ8_ACAPL|nr:YTH domain-containing protein 1-like isoform X4 [Acanthaster planci]
MATQDKGDDVVDVLTDLMAPVDDEFAEEMDTSPAEKKPATTKGQTPPSVKKSTPKTSKSSSAKTSKTKTTKTAAKTTPKSSTPKSASQASGEATSGGDGESAKTMPTTATRIKKVVKKASPGEAPSVTKSSSAKGAAKKTTQGQKRASSGKTTTKQTAMPTKKDREENETGKAEETAGSAQPEEAEEGKRDDQDPVTSPPPTKKAKLKTSSKTGIPTKKKVATSAKEEAESNQAETEDSLHVEGNNKPTEDGSEELEASIPGLGFEEEAKKEEPKDVEETRPDAMIAQDLEGFDTRSEASSSDESESSLSDVSAEQSEDKPRKHRPRKRSISPIVYERSGKKGSGLESGGEKQAPMESLSKVRKADPTSKLKYLFRDARYFLIKSNNHENVALAKARGVWSTLPNNEQMLNQAFRESRNVLLIFSVKESGKFQGFARMRSESRRDGPNINWVLPNGMSRSVLGGVFKIDWITRQELAFSKTGHLFNSWNDNKPVKIGRDGQEVETRCGEALCRLFPQDEHIDVVEILRDARRRRREMATRRNREPLRLGLQPYGLKNTDSSCLGCYRSERGHVAPDDGLQPLNGVIVDFITIEQKRGSHGPEHGRRTVLLVSLSSRTV